MNTADANVYCESIDYDIDKTNIKDGINDLLIARDKILEQMFRDLGVKMYNPKKAQVNTDEIESNDQLLLISLDDMKKARQEGLEAVNDMFGTNIVVRVNERFDVQTYDREAPEERSEEDVRG